jgi:hypothetical protein
MIYRKTFPQQNKTQIIQYIAALCGSLRGAQAGYRRPQAQTPRSEPLETRAMQPLYELSSCSWLPGNSFSLFVCNHFEFGRVAAMAYKNRTPTKPYSRFRAN